MPDPKQDDPDTYLRQLFAVQGSISCVPGDSATLVGCFQLVPDPTKEDHDQNDLFLSPQPASKCVASSGAPVPMYGGFCGKKLLRQDPFSADGIPLQFTDLSTVCDAPEMAGQLDFGCIDTEQQTFGVFPDGTTWSVCLTSKANPQQCLGSKQTTLSPCTSKPAFVTGEAPRTPGLNDYVWFMKPGT